MARTLCLLLAEVRRCCQDQELGPAQFLRVLRLTAPKKKIKRLVKKISPGELVRLPRVLKPASWGEKTDQ